MCVNKNLTQDVTRVLVSQMILRCIITTCLAFVQNLSTASWAPGYGSQILSDDSIYYGQAVQQFWLFKVAAPHSINAAVSLRTQTHTHTPCSHAVADVAADCSYTVQAGSIHLNSTAHTFCRSPMLLIQSVMRLLFLAGSSTLATACGRLLPPPACTAPRPWSSAIHACYDPHGRSP